MSFDPEYKDLKFYRYEGTYYVGKNGISTATIHTKVLRVVRRTDKGFWVAEFPYSKLHFIRDNTRKAYAYQTEELAQDSFVQRCNWRIKHLERQLVGAKAIQHGLTEALGIDPAKYTTPK